jgi:Tol biopolymer transport system component
MTLSRAGAKALTCLLAGVLPLVVVPDARAQYFGRNKVQYESFDFHVLRTTHFDIYFYPAEQDAASVAARMAERWYTRLTTVFHHPLRGRQPLILYATQSEFQQTNVVEGLGEGTGGVTEGLRRRVVLPTGGTLDDLNHVIGHELVHAFQYDITGSGNPNSRGRLPAATDLPLWFIEGMAEYLSLGPATPLTAMWMRGGVQDSVKDSLPSYRQLTDPRFFPYRYGQALLAYVGGEWGDERIGDLLRAAGRMRSIDQAIRGVLSLTPDQLVARWHEATHAAYDPLQATTEAPGAYGPRLIGVREGAGQYNVSPSVSPDGKRVMFFSDRGLFSIDLYLADAQTGKVERQITRTALDPHLQSLQFIQSAGSWSADGRRFVFAAVSHGRPQLDLYDVERARIEREVRLPKLGDILNPSLSPDGRAVVFSALSGGLTDLFIYDLQANKLTRLTTDRFAELQPAWSPDGKTIAFATDRFTTRLDDLAIGPYGLALMDPATGRISRVPGFAGAKHLNPQWSPDGASLYFLSDPDGISNIYRVRLADGELRRVTNLFTGASGITETSPAMSVAQQSGRLVYSVFRTNGYEVYAIDGATTLAGAALARPPARNAQVLPPQDRSNSLVLRLLRDPVGGLPESTDFATRPYRPGLALTYIGQPSLGVGTSEFGTYVGGGAALYFSDVLGNHNLATALQVNGGIKDVTALVAYQNMSHRLNWAAVVDQVPYTTGSFASGTTTLDGEPVFAEQELVLRQTNRDIQGLLSYPFNEVQRLDFSAGYSHISFDQELRTIAVSAVTGEEVLNQKEDLPAGDPLDLGTASAALVYDNSFFGATGPILGQRYRLEVSPTVGSIDFVGVLADYRRYFMPARPFTLAARILHYGRYGSGGEDPRLQPLFLGYSGLVRGYRLGSFDASECHPPADQPDACPVFDQLLGSRMAVGNLELRFPLLGVLGLGSGYYGALPLDFTLFGDGGLAWDTANEPSLTGGSRKAVFSAGAGLRFNLFGFAVLEADLVHPFQRPDKNWVWELNFQPGF